MRIALVILHADPARGGAERYTIDLAHALAKDGHEVHLLATSFADEVPAAMRVRMNFKGITRVRRYKRFLDSLDSYLQNNHYDVVHAMLPVRTCDVYHPHAGMAAKQVHKLNALFNQRRRAMAAVERHLLEGTHPPIVLALSEYVKTSIREFYEIPDERLPTVFNAVDLDRYQSGPPPSHEGVNALFVGQDFDRKGLAEALAAADQLGDDRLSITVVGDDDHMSSKSKVNYAGGVSDPRPYYREADFFVLPTRHDPCSLVVLEALAMGLPVISTKFNGACEIMTDGVHGFILDDPKDVNTLADAMRKMLDPATRAKMREACLVLRPQLSYEHHLKKLLAIYEKIATAKS